MWYDQQHNLVVYDTPDPRVLDMTRDGKQLHNGYKAFPATLYNLQVARYLGLNVPPLMAYKYDWPRDKRSIPVPFRAQFITANFLALHPRAFCLSDMGTGKTLAALWAADFVMSQYEPGTCRCLVVAPLSTLNRVWSDALFQNFLGRRTCQVLYGTRKQRHALLSKPADFYIINYDGLDIIGDELANRPDIRMAIVDEASAYKDRGTRRHRLARHLFATTDYLWLMSGTPTPNAPTDAWGLAKLVNNAHGESYMSFHHRAMYQVSKWKWLPRQGSHALAHKLMQPSIRFAIEDCMDLPPCTVQARDVEMTKEQVAAYKQLKRDAVMQTSEGPVNAVNEAVLRGKLLQICAGGVYTSTDSREVAHLDCTPRINAVKEIIEQTSQKVIVFAPFTSVIDMLHSELSKTWTVEKVDGRTSAGERNDIFGRFQDVDDIRVIVAHPGTMAHGITLTRASVVVWFAPIDKTELYLQGNKRIDRPGQRSATSVIQLAATPIEREIYRRLEHNETMMGLTLLLAKEQDQ